MKNYFKTTSLFLFFSLLLFFISASKEKENIKLLIESKLPIIPSRVGPLVALQFGTPPQIVSAVILDTGSSLTWFPCRFDVSPFTTNNMVFHPNLSTSSMYVTCNNPKYKLFVNPKGKDFPCRQCEANNSAECSLPIDYNFCSYETGNKGHTTKMLMSETLHIGQLSISNFIFGCAFASLAQNGNLGFGRGFESFASQNRIEKFSYCIPRTSSSLLNDKSKKGYLILNGESRFTGLNYVPFYKNPYVSKFRDYYYVSVAKIVIGYKVVEIPSEFLVPGSDGHGGSVVDTGTSDTLMKISIFETVMRTFQSQIGHAKHIFVGYMSNKMPCFNSSGVKDSKLPKLKFIFEGGASMNLPSKNYMFKIKNDTGIFLCLSIRPKIITPNVGPAIVLGDHMLRNFYMEYDLVKERLGFRAENC